VSLGEMAPQQSQSSFVLREGFRHRFLVERSPHTIDLNLSNIDRAYVRNASMSIVFSAEVTQTESALGVISLRASDGSEQREVSASQEETSGANLECQLRNTDGRLHLRLIAEGIAIGSEIAMHLAFKVSLYAKEPDLDLQVPDVEVADVEDYGAHECHICLQGGGQICRTSCGHCFHFECLTSWFNQRNGSMPNPRSCPLCRHEYDRVLTPVM